MQLSKEEWLRNKVKDSENSTLGIDAKASISEELEKLRATIANQESLINGFQKENERLYNELKKRKASQGEGAKLIDPSVACGDDSQISCVSENGTKESLETARRLVQENTLLRLEMHQLIQETGYLKEALKKNNAHLGSSNFDQLEQGE
ncbi:unnamed protein product [Protopolystoma xenopodis]|uniref:Uncharacterized protein n=1 Tax=Protopolystoma xenopodis TaxID=117903 RepID=A0A3S5A155_9PLAT|nr:unnamed protein product [Protopolystoma xenopodis]